MSLEGPMNLDRMDPSSMKRYLLHQMPPAEREVWDDRLVTDSELFAQLEAFETEWIDRLVRAELAPAEAEALQQYLATTGQQHRLVAASALAAFLASDVVPLSPRRPLMSPTPHRRWLLGGGLAAALALVGAMAWQFTGWPLDPGQPTSPRLEDAAPPQTSPRTPAPLAIHIPAGRSRGSNPAREPVRTLIPDQMLELHLEIPEGRRFGSYRAVLLGAGDAPVMEAILFAESTAPDEVRVLLSAEPLRQSRQEVMLLGVQPGQPDSVLGYYRFQVQVAAPNDAKSGQ